MPGKDAVKLELQTTLRERLGPEVDINALPDLVFMGHVDDFYATYEWSSGGMIHMHMAFWIVGSPRIDKVIVPKEQRDQVIVTERATCDTDVVLPQTEAANLMACFWDRVIAEFNVAKALDQFSQALPAQFGINHRDGKRNRVEAEIWEETREWTAVARVYFI